MDIDKEIRKCVLHKHDLNRSLDRKEISEQEFNNQLTIINDKLKELNDKKITILSKKYEDIFVPSTKKEIKELAVQLAVQGTVQGAVQQDNLHQEPIIKNTVKPTIKPTIKPIIKTMVKPIIKNTVKVKGSNIIKKHSGTYRDLIIQALLHPKIDSEEKLLVMVNEWRPGKHKEEIRKQTRDLICLIKNNKIKKYSLYTWDNENYKLIKNVQLLL